MRNNMDYQPAIKGDNFNLLWQGDNLLFIIVHCDEILCFVIKYSVVVTD